MVLGEWELALAQHPSAGVMGTTLEYGPAAGFLRFSTKNNTEESASLLSLVAFYRKFLN